MQVIDLREQGDTLEHQLRVLQEEKEAMEHQLSEYQVLQEKHSRM